MCFDIGKKRDKSIMQPERGGGEDCRMECGSGYDGTFAARFRLGVNWEAGAVRLKSIHIEAAIEISETYSKF